eukprot:3457329-Rhodomonas_salina.1
MSTDMPGPIHPTRKKPTPVATMTRTPLLILRRTPVRFSLIGIPTSIRCHTRYTPGGTYPIPGTQGPSTPAGPHLDRNGQISEIW